MAIQDFLLNKCNQYLNLIATQNQKWWPGLVCLMAYQPFMSYLMPKFGSFLN